MKFYLSLLLLVCIFSCQKEDPVEMPPEEPIFTPFTIQPPPVGVGLSGQSKPVDLNDDGIDDVLFVSQSFQSSGSGTEYTSSLRGLNGTTLARKTASPLQGYSLDTLQLVTLPSASIISDTLDFQTQLDVWIAYSRVTQPVGYGPIYTNGENVGSTIYAVGEGSFGKFWIQIEVETYIRFTVLNFGLSDIVGENPVI